MSDERFDMLDRRLGELVNITGNLVVAVRGLNDKVDLLTEQQKETNRKVDALSEDVKNTNKRLDTTNTILEDALSRIIDLQKGQNETNSRIESLEDRVGIIEDKIAA